VKFLIELELFYHPRVFYNMCMRRYLRMIFILFVAVSCAGLPVSLLPPASTPTTISQPTFSATNTQAPYESPFPTSSPLPPWTTPFFTLTAPATPEFITSLTPAPGDFQVLFHPDDVLYVGDQVSLEVIPPPGMDVKGSSLQIQVDPPDGQSLPSTNFNPWGIAGREQATFIWSWDTKNLSPGTHTLSFDIHPQGISWTEQVNLLPAIDMPPDQADAHWATTQTKCCTVYYITNTASERDLAQLTASIDQQAQDAMLKMGANFTEPITITILPRLLGHGGFTSTEISVSYLDRNYASNSWEMVVHHEMIHAIDGRLGGDFRPTLFVEGLAVYLSGGHYKPEPLMPRAAALLPQYLNWYIPLKTLADNFYASQHEIGYLEGASLIEYMVGRYGEPAFNTFYRDIHNKSGESQSDSINAALQKHFAITFDQLEQDFLTALENEPDTASWVEDVRLTVTYYDTMRRYQQLLDPSAYFRTAWLMDNKTMREKGIVADYLRHPHTPSNLALETLFITAHQNWENLDYASASSILAEINSVLDGIDRGSNDPFSVSRLTADYLAISDTLQKQGYEVQNISVSGDTASTQVTTSTNIQLEPVNLVRTGGQWSIVP
jgi:hypothetical protein